MAMTVVGRKESIPHAGWNDRILTYPAYEIDWLNAY